ncbi:MAG: long-chain fatty acid--CoA ligase [Bacteroidota bacterium]
MTFRTDWLDRVALYHPDRTALVWEPSGTAYTYAQCDALAERLAAGLAHAYGIAPGDRVAILAENTVEHVLLLFAAQRAGFVLVPLNFRLATPELDYIASDADPALLVYSDAYADTVAQLSTAARRLPLDGEGESLAALLAEGATDAPAPRVRRDADDPLMLLYTSGTTGRPKGAIISHGMVAWNAANTALRLDLTTADISFNAAPFYHTGGWNVLLTPFLQRGATTVLLDRFDPDRLLRLCDDAGVTILWGVPTMLQMMAQSPEFDTTTLDTVRYAIVGGEPMPAPLIRTWQAKGVPIRQGFGMTEVGVNCFSLPERDALRKIGSIGFPNFYVDTRVVDDDGQDVPPGEPGELLMRGPVVTPGYWRNPIATAKAIRDGWFHSGDLVRVDDEGYVYVVGRKKDMYISGGENVYPAEVEAVLVEHEAVAEAAVVGVPDAKWGEVGMAFLVPADPAAPPDAEALIAFARARLARFKVPAYIRVVDALPKGHSGKVLKRDLQAQATEEAP